MVILTEHPYIVKDDRILRGEPIIKGTSTPVRAIVENWRLGYQPAEIPSHLPHISLAQVFDALSYYQDHLEEINYYIELNNVSDEELDQRIKNRRNYSAKFKKSGVIIAFSPPLSRNEFPCRGGGE
jgi:uncharacterized protein (DUF433 family)